ncbi:MAG: hypothetical protein NPIRA01_23370 [Nitrospirales bacterium]|nr:MAG: hypothetical protein NPIRA01_23370 [Nitrospirales bacterium]
MNHKIDELPSSRTIGMADLSKDNKQLIPYTVAYEISKATGQNPMISQTYKPRTCSDEFQVVPSKPRSPGPKLNNL